MSLYRFKGRHLAQILDLQNSVDGKPGLSKFSSSPLNKQRSIHQLDTDDGGNSVQAEASLKAQKEIARRERERLRLQEKLRKENLEKLRREQDGAAESDNVRPFCHTFLAKQQLRNGHAAAFANLRIGEMT